MSSLTNDPIQVGSWEIVLLRAAAAMSLSEPQYATIEHRYARLGEIFDAATHPLLRDANIFVQGSIGLRTTNKPAPGATGEMATIDADAVVWLPHAGGASAMEVLEAVEARVVEGSRVEHPIQKLRRGVRIVYADESPGFHIDVTPARCAPGNSACDGHGYLLVPDRELGWKCSSPRTYNNWLAGVAAGKIRIVDYDALVARNIVLAEAKQEPIPTYSDYIDGNPLRAAIKLLKRHRDMWAIGHNKASVRPISAILTTLAGLAYADVAKESQYMDYRAIDAIIAIVERLPKYIAHKASDGYSVLNPTDKGENFAEKWNRPNGEGRRYVEAFYQWHAVAVHDIRMGQRDLGSAAAFSSSMNEAYGVSKTLVDEVVDGLPRNWTLPGRSAGLSANVLSLGILTGDPMPESQSSIVPVRRLG